MTFSGFPRNVRFTPVPNPLFGPLLEEIDDLTELRCTLRLIWLLHQKRGHPRTVSHKELLADRTLLKVFAEGGKEPESEIGRGLELAIERGTILSTRPVGGTQGPPRYALNTETDRRALAGTAEGPPVAEPTPPSTAWEGVIDRPNIFGLYEDNIGMLSPMISEELREAEQIYPHSWIEDAFREAVSRNRRSWRYIATILERWEREGRSDGEPGRHPKKTGYEEYFRR